MIGINEIRKIIADNPVVIRDIMLTSQESEIFSWLRRSHKVLSSQVADEFCLSAQHACMVMDRLYRKGYVDRMQRPQESGGYEYEYTSQID